MILFFFGIKNFVILVVSASNTEFLLLTWHPYNSTTYQEQLVGAGSGILCPVPANHNRDSWFSQQLWWLLVLTHQHQSHYTSAP